MRKLVPVPLPSVQITGGFWLEKTETNRKNTIPYVYRQLDETGRLAAMNLNWREGQPNKPHVFYDSDVAKWIEAAAYSLVHHPNPELEAQVDAYVDAMERAQADDGYLNSYFLGVEPQKRWTNLRDLHELYCAGHLLEAAIAYAQATGKRKILDILCRYIDHIDAIFGPGEHQKHGYPGHQEIELALVKLYRLTGERRYLNLAKYFIDERGQSGPEKPHYYDLEARARGDDPRKYHFYRYGNYAYVQAHKPVREQETVTGHAVRAMYMYSGMVDVAAETGDETLLAAARRLWDDLTGRNLYITGGAGSTATNEGFTAPYDLPNESAYAETCASIALAFWAHRMLQVEPHRRYADVLERALYNGILSGVSRDGTRFFYANPLASKPASAIRSNGSPDAANQTPERQDWFGCSCCPPNVARLFAGLGEYIYAAGKTELYVHLYIASQARLTLAGQTVEIDQYTGYPWDEDVELRVNPAAPARFTLALRIPGWCRGARLFVNDEEIDLAQTSADGYARVERLWSPGDRVSLRLPMPVERVAAHPRVWQDAGRLALMRGPLVYCLEEIDNGPNLEALRLAPDPQFETAFDSNLLGGVVVIRARGYRRSEQGWEGALYRPIAETREEPVTLTAVPYALWANRGRGEMLVWIRGA